MKVSVAMITYNHEKFIAQAVESVLMQETDFDYEIVVGEDCSTDGTREILLSLQKKYPHRIRLLLPEYNIGASYNFVNTFQACRGQYIAFLDGDDYWTRADKLQRQVEFLDSHPSCVICTGKVRHVDENGNDLGVVSPPEYSKRISDFEDLMTVGFFVRINSAIIRAGLVNDVPDSYHRLRVGDWAFFTLVAQHGQIGFLDEVWAVYRLHSQGAWGGLTETEQWQNVIESRRWMLRHFGGKYTRTLNNTIAYYHGELSRVYAKSGKRLAAKRHSLFFYLRRLRAESPVSALRILTGKLFKTGRREQANGNII